MPRQPRELPKNDVAYHTVMPTTPTESTSSNPTDATLTVLIADKFEPSGVEATERMGCRVEVQPDLTPETLPSALATIDPEVLVVRSTKVPAVIFDRDQRLSLVIRAGAGFDNIDVAAASARGVFVANCPGKNALAVAELVWGLILSCDRRIPDQTDDLRQGVWNKKAYAKAARGLYGRTLGVIGLGRIGQAVIERGHAFGMKVVACSRSLTPERAGSLGIDYRPDAYEVARDADIVSLHVASTPETKHLANEAFFTAMREGSTFINTSRGAVVDHEALAKAIRTRGIQAGLDVYERQPSPSDSAFADPIMQVPGVYGTHHIGASTAQAQEAIAAETIRIIEVYLKTGEVPHCVNRAAASPATCMMTVRHLNRTGVLAHVFHVLSEARINVQEMENVIYDGAHAACARIRLDDGPKPEQVAEIRRNDAILSVTLTAVRAKVPVEAWRSKLRTLDLHSG